MILSQAWKRENTMIGLLLRNLISAVLSPYNGKSSGREREMKWKMKLKLGNIGIQGTSFKLLYWGTILSTLYIYPLW